jgi:hypothetical protein
VLIEVVSDGLLQLTHAREDAAPDALGRDLREEPLDEVEPGSGGRREVQLEAGMRDEPSLHLGRLVRTVVVEDEMHVEVLFHAPVDALQEADELGRAMSRQALADHFAALHVERGEQRRRAVALVVVRHRRGAALLERQARLRAIQRLNLALFIVLKARLRRDAQHQRAVRRVHVEADDVRHLLLEHRVARHLEPLDEMRLEPRLRPDPLHGRVADADRLRHPTHAPVRRVRRRLVGRHLEDLELYTLRQRLPAWRSRLVAQKPLDAFLREALLPAPHARLRLAGEAGDRLDCVAVGAGEHDLSTPDNLRRGVAIAHQSFETGAILRCHDDVGLHSNSLTDLHGQGNPPSVTEH